MGEKKNMEVKVTKGVLVIKHKLKKNEAYRINEGSRFQSVTIMKKPQIVNGFSNLTEDNLSILLIDYDGVDKSVVLEDYALLQKKFRLPQAYLLTTKEGNFHVVCVKKFTNAQIPKILFNTRCDENYKTMAIRSPYRSYVLRISTKKGSKKPTFVEMIGEEKNLNYEVSTAHKGLMEKLYPNLPKIKYQKEDGLKQIKLQSYETG